MLKTEREIVFDFMRETLMPVAEAKAKEVLERVEKEMFKTPGMSPDEYPCLKSFWEEVCVQVQGEQSSSWDDDFLGTGGYLQCIRNLISDTYSSLAPNEKNLLWFLTPEFCDWVDDADDKEVEKYEYIGNEETDVCEHLLSELLTIAGSHSNKRIRRQLDLD